jgi:hypothetical protein
LNPADLNLRAQCQNFVDTFVIDDYFTFLEVIGEIYNYSKTREGEFETIKNAIPFGLRVKYFLNSYISISLGFDYISKNQVSTIINQYTTEYRNSTVPYFYSNEYSPFTLSIKGYIPTLGIHVGKKIADPIGVEGFLTGGLLFARCGYSFENFSESILDAGISMHDSDLWHNKLEEKGRGTGFSFNIGARVYLDITRNLGFFMEGGYAYRLVKKLTGSGRFTDESGTETWKGDWEIKKRFKEMYWGYIHYQYPSNYWEGADESLETRDFKLDLSGFQVKVGIYFRF